MSGVLVSTVSTDSNIGLLSRMGVSIAKDRGDASHRSFGRGGGGSANVLPCNFLLIRASSRPNANTL